MFFTCPLYRPIRIFFAFPNEPKTRGITTVNRDQTLDLFLAGIEAWNAWAETMLVEKRALQDANEWIDGAETDWNEPTRRWHERATADFSDHVFSDWVNFARFRFPGDAMFWGTTFENGVDFSHTEFHHAVTFDRATFGDNAEFKDTTFKSESSFIQATFSNYLMIENSTFSGTVRFLAATISRFAGISGSVFFEDAMFSQSNLEAPLHINDSTFKKNANFMAVGGKGLFLRNVTFARLPSFTGAHFEAAPQFDPDQLDPRRLNKFARKSTASLYPASWRALKRLATQGHDHECEFQFFTGEILARRGAQDKPIHLRFWAGWLYEIFSDFGRSMIRPLGWLALSTCIFAGVYASNSAEFSQFPVPLDVQCVSGPGDPQVAVWILSVHKAFPFTGIGSSGKLEQIYTCLYGLQPSNPFAQGPLSTGPYPNIPDSVAFLGVLQFFLSAVLIFLFVLAIRNWFRIR